MELRRRKLFGMVFILMLAATTLTTSFGVSTLFTPQVAHAAQTIPYKVNFQGRLTDNSGNILADGLYNIKFRFFDAITSGTNVFEEDRVRSAVDNRVQITNGLFNIQFGDLTALSPTLFAGTFPLFLEVELPTPATATCATNGCASFTEGAMTPRQPLASSAYAFNSDTLDGLDSTAFGQLAASNTFTGANIFTPTSGVGITVRAATSTHSLDVKDSGGTIQAYFDASGILNVGQTIQATAGTVDLGTSGTTFRTGYFGTSVQTPALNASSTGGTITTNLGTLQRVSSGTTTIDLKDAGNTVLAVTNSGGGVAGISATGGLTIGTGKVITVGATAGTGVTCSSGQILDAITVAGGVVTGGTCIAAGGGDKLSATWTSTQATTATNTQTTVQFTGTANSAPSFNNGTHVLTLPSNASKITVETKGAGGGGGSVGTTSAVKAAGGGGEGGDSQTFITGSLPANYYFNVGTGGTGGATGGTNNGTVGGSTCFGTNAATACTSPLASAVGGSGGVGVTTAIPALGGAGGLAASGVGDIKQSGAPGGTSVAVATTGIESGNGGGRGGAVGLAGAAAAANGNNGTSGGGGSGAIHSPAAVTSHAGGNGGDGYLVITVYTTVAGTGNPATLQSAYDNSTNPEIVLSGSGLTVRDSSGGLGSNLFEVQDNTGATNYLAVTTAGVSTSGVFSASTTNTINGLSINSGSLSGVNGYNQASGTFVQSYSAATATTAHAISVTNTNAGAGVTMQGINLTPANAITPSSGTNTLNLLNFAAGTTNTGTLTNGINFASATGYTNFIQSPSFDLNSSGDQTTAFTLLDGTTTTNGAGTAATSLVLTSAALFDIGNYVQVNDTNCGGAGVNPCYAKITNKVSNTLTITPALTWTTGKTVNEYHVPEIGGVDTTQALANRYGRGYFISGVAAGNGTTYYNEDSIDTSLTSFNLLTNNVTTLNIGNGSTAVTIPGNLTVTGNTSAPSTGTAGYISRSGTTLSPATAGDNLTTTGNISTTGSGTISAAGGISVSSGQTYKVNGTQISSADLSNDSNITKQGNTFNGATQLIQTTAGSAYPALNGSAITSLTSGNLTGALPAISGASLTSLTSSVLTGALPAISGASLTSLTSSALTGALPAISGASLTSLTASVLTGALPAISGASLTNLNASSLTQGTGAVTLQSAAATGLTVTANAASTWSTSSGNLTIDSGGGTLILGTNTTTIQKAANALSVDLATASTSTLTIKNSNGVNVANLAVTGGLSIGSGQTYKVNGTQISSADLSNDSSITKQSNTFNGASQLIQTTAGSAYPALNGSAITSLTSGNLTGALPAISGASLTSLTASVLTGALPAISGASLTSLNPTNLSAGSGAVSLSSGTATGLTLDSTNGTLVLGTNTTTVQKIGTALAFDLSTASTSTITIKNSNGVNLANLAVTGGVSIGSGQTYKVNGTQISSADLSNDSNITKQGNTFNGASQLIQTTAGSAYPALSGAAITSLTSGNLTGALPAISGASLTSLTSSALSGALPAISGASLTSLTSSALTGALPAISGASLTSLTASVLTGALPAISGASLTNLNASSLAQGTGAVSLQSAAATGLTVTANAASTWSTSSGNLTIDSGGGTLILGTNTTTVQKAANALSIDLATAATSTLTIKNSNGVNVANLAVTGNIDAGTGKIFSIGGTQISSAALSNDSSITKQGNSFNGATQLIQTTAGSAYPALSGAAITSLTSGNLTGALPAISGASLTALTSSVLTGALPAISGAALTSLTSSALSGALPAISGAALTSLNPTNLSQGSGAVTLQSAAATALTLTSNAAATWSTTGATQLTVQSGSGTLGLGSTTIVNNTGGSLTINSASASGLSLVSGTTGNLTLDTGTTGSILIGGSTSSAKIISVGPTITNTNTTTINLGINTAGAQDVNIGSAGSGDANASSLVSIQGGTTVNTAVVIGTNGAGGITIDSGTTGNVNIGSGANSKTTNIGSATGTSSTVIEGGATAGTAIAIGNGGTAHVIAIGTGTAVQGITIGSTTTTSSTSIEGGATAGTAVAIGNGTSSHVIGIGSGSTGTQLVTIGSSNVAADALTLDAGNTGKLQIGNSTAAHTIQIGAGAGAAGNAQSIVIGSPTTTTASLVTVQGGNISTAAGSVTGVVIGGGFSTSDTNLVGLSLDSSSTYVETASTCSNTANGGAIYYNSTSNSIRACVRDGINSGGNWEDLPSTAGLGAILFGVVPDSGLAANQGDWAAIGGSTVGPCKVSWASATTVSVAPCNAYSNGRKVVVASATVVTMPAMTTGQFTHVCFNTAGAVVASTAGTETANIPTFSANNPILCLADVLNAAGANTIGKIYDVRTFTTTTKEFVTNQTTLAGLGQTVSTMAAVNSVTQVPTTTNTSILRGVVVAQSTATSNSAITTIIATRGPQWVKFAAAAGTLNAFLQPITGGVAGYLNSSATVGTIGYGNLGLQLRLSDNATCSTTANCQMSVPTDINLR